MYFKNIKNQFLICFIVVSAFFTIPAFAHNGVDHGTLKHRQVDGTDILFEVHTQSEYKKKFMNDAKAIQNSHILVVHLMHNKQYVANAQIKVKLIGPDQKTIGSESGQNLAKVTLKNRSHHYASGFNLNQKGKYIAVVLFQVNSKLTQTSFEFSL